MASGTPEPERQQADPWRESGRRESGDLLWSVSGSLYALCGHDQLVGTAQIEAAQTPFILDDADLCTLHLDAEAGEVSTS